MSRTEYDWNVVVENEEGDEIWDSGFGVIYSGTDEEAYQAGLAHLTCETDTISDHLEFPLTASLQGRKR